MEGGYSSPLARTRSSSAGSKSPEHRKFVAMESANILSKNTMEREQVLFCDINIYSFNIYVVEASIEQIKKGKRIERSSVERTAEKQMDKTYSTIPVCSRSCR